MNKTLGQPVMPAYPHGARADEVPFFTVGHNTVPTPTNLLGALRGAAPAAA